MTTSATGVAAASSSKPRSRGGGGGGGGGAGAGAAGAAGVGSRGGGGGGSSQPLVRLKVTIRRLPSLLKEEEFRDALAEYINENTIEHCSWIPGKISEDRNKPPAYSRCYLKLKSTSDLTALSEALRLHGAFVDSKGNTSVPQMEFAPFQKAPKKTARVDARAGTIDEDPEFIAFAASLKAGPGVATNGTTDTSNGTISEASILTIPANDPMSVPLPSSDKLEKPTTTPLIEFLRTQKATASDKSLASGTKSKSERSKDGKEKEMSTSKRIGKRGPEKLNRTKEKEKEKDREDKATSTRQIINAIHNDVGILKREKSGAQQSLKREGSSNIAASGSGTSAKGKEVAVTGPEKEKAQPRERRRERGNAAGIASLIQRDLGLGPRRSRAPKSTITPEAPAADSSAQEQPSTPTTSTAPPPPSPADQLQSPKAPTRNSRRSEGRRGRHNKGNLEREESMTSAPSSGPSPPIAPMAILKKQGSSALPAGPTVPTPQVPVLLKRDSSMASGSVVIPTGPALSIATAVNHQISASSPTTPTAPRGRRHGRGGGGGGNSGRAGRGGHANSSAVEPPIEPAPPSTTGPPTVPSGDSMQQSQNRGGRGRGGGNRRGGSGPSGGGNSGRGGNRGGRGRGAFANVGVEGPSGGETSAT